MPSATDTAVEAFEPNENGPQAAPVPMGRWIEAAWDYRPFAPADADHYRFQAQAGARIRFSLRNPNTEGILLVQDFSPGQGGITPGPGREMTEDYLIRTAGEQRFQIRPVSGFTGRYAFRIDSLP